METCNSCRVCVKTKADFCPLCGATLEKGGDCGTATKAVNHYPDLRRQSAQYDLFSKVLLFITIFGCAYSILLNWLVSPGFWWSAIVIAAALYCWMLIPALLRKGVNFVRQIVFQVLLTCAIVILIDYITGYRGWSVSYVVPGVLSAGILSTGVMTVLNRTKWSQMVFYQVLICVFGFIPLVLYLLGIAHSLVMVLITVGLALADLILTLLFADRSIKNEFIKRFHF